MLLLSVEVLGVLILDAIRELVLGMSIVINVLMTVLVLPGHLDPLALDRTVEVLERVGLVTGHPQEHHRTQDQQNLD